MRPFDKVILILPTLYLIVSGCLLSQNKIDTNSRELEQKGHVTDVLVANQEVSLFVRALRDTNLWHAIADANAVTLFVPTDRAMKAEGSAFLLESVLVSEENESRMIEFLSHHVILDTNLSIDTLATIQSVSAISEGCISIQSSGDSIKIGPEAYHIGHSSATNGTIHFIDRALWQHYDSPLNCKTGTKSAAQID